MLPFKRGEGRDIGASAGVMDAGWEGGGSSSAHCSCAKARGWGQRGPENMTSQWKKKKIIKSCLNLEWSKFNPQVFVFLLPELLKRNVNQHGENCAKHLSLMWAVCIYNPICQISGKKWILVKQLKNRQEWNRILFPRIVSDQGIAAHTKYMLHWIQSWRAYFTMLHISKNKLSRI